MTKDSNSPAIPSDTRRHDLDALRATAMLLGIALHAALSFIEIPWRVQDRYQPPAFGTFVSAIHGFRMPLFFMLSGFFTAMLWRKRGLKGLLWQRTKRVLLPLVIGCVTIVPVMWVIILAILITTIQAPVDPEKDLWSAAVSGNLDAVRAHIDGGASLDARDTRIAMTPLGWAVMGD